MQHSAGMGSGKTARPDEKMGRSAGKHLHTGGKYVRDEHYTSAQNKATKKMAAKKRRQRDKEF